MEDIGVDVVRRITAEMVKEYWELITELQVLVIGSKGYMRLPRVR